MKTKIIALILALLPVPALAQSVPPPVFGQQFMELPPNSVVGNVLPQSSPSSAVSFATIGARLGFNCPNSTCQVPLGSAVIGNLPLSNLAIGSLDQVIGYFGATTANAIAISNCANALTYSTTTHTFGCNTIAGTGTVTTAGTGLSLSGGGSTLNLALTNATLQATPTAGTTLATVNDMLGTGATCKITPVYSGRVHIDYVGNAANNTSNTTLTAQLRFGTGTAPAAAAAATGTQVGANQTVQSTTAGAIGNFVFAVNVGSLTVGTQIWIDLSGAASAGTEVFTNLSCAAFEY